MKLTRGDLQVTNGLFRTALTHFRAMRPERGGAAKRREQLVIIGQSAEKPAGKLGLPAPPGGKSASPIGHESPVAGRTNSVAGLPDGLVIDAKNKIGMRNLAAQLSLFLFREVAAVALILDNFERAAWPAAPNGAPHLAGHPPGCTRRGPATRIDRDRRAVTATAAEPITIQIARFGRRRRGGVFRPTLFGQPENAAGIGMIVIEFQPGGELAVG